MSKFKNWLKKAGQKVPELIEVGDNLVKGNVFSAITDVVSILKGKETPEAQELLNEFKSQSMQFELEAFELESKDRFNARDLYKQDNLIQKVLATVFTLAYFGISYVLINHFFTDESKLADYELGFLSTLFGAMSSKVNTIIDFFFGGSVKSEK